MCWINKKCEIKVATEDITCYKVVKKLNEHKYRSIYLYKE